VHKAAEDTQKEVGLPSHRFQACQSCRPTTSRSLALLRQAAAHGFSQDNVLGVSA